MSALLVPSTSASLRGYRSSLDQPPALVPKAASWNVGGVNGGPPPRSKPMTSRNLRSVSVTALTTPESLKARQESFPALLAQSPKSPFGLVLKLFKLVAPPLIEKYPGVVPEKLRTRGEE